MLHPSFVTYIVTSSSELAVKATELIESLSSQSSALVLVFPMTEKSVLASCMCEKIDVMALSEPLSEALLGYASSSRADRIESCIEDLLQQFKKPIVWLERIEVLFEPSLELDPLHLLKRLARLKPIVAMWPDVGAMSADSISFSIPGRDDYQVYPAKVLANIPVIQFVVPGDLQ